MEADIMQTNDSSRQFKGFYIERTDDSSRHIRVIQYAGQHFLWEYVAGIIESNSNPSSINTWYHFKIQMENGVLSCEITDMNNTVLLSGSWTLDSYYQNKTIRSYIFAYDTSNTIRFRNVLIKPL